MTLNKSLTALTNPILRLGRYHAVAINPNTLLGDNDPCIAQQPFDRTSLRQHNELLLHYSRNRRTRDALHLFVSLYCSGLSPDKYTMPFILNVCARSFDGTVGEHVHCQCVKSGLVHNVFVGSSLVDMYMKTGNVRDGSRVFDEMVERNVISWTSMISGYLQNGGTDEALNLFSQMRRAGVKPDDFTYSAILTVQQQHAVFISEIHAEVIKTNYEKSAVAGTALKDAYAKIGNIKDAVKVFELIEAKDIITWSAMLARYARIGETEEAAKIFRQLTRVGIKPDAITFCSIINAMYAKRGNIDSAHEVFKRQTERSLVSWTSMISGYAQHGQAKKALEVFEEMQKQNLKVNAITFTGVLSACTHAGLVDKGQYYFNVMINDHHINPTMEHYSCMVDLYSRAGMLEKAMDIINGMPFPPNASVWCTVLAASRVHCNIELGKHAAEKIISLEPQHSAAYVLLSNTFDIRCR